MIKKNKFIYNLIYAFSAQATALLLSLIMSFFVPKLLGVREFSYWQLFLFYSGYVGIAQLGLADGVYLRLGGKEYTELQYPVLGTQFWLLGGLQVAAAVCIAVISFYMRPDYERYFTIQLVCIYLVIFNLWYYLAFIFQATNQTRIYSKAVIIDKIFFLACVLLLLIFQIKRFEVYIELYTISKALALVYFMIKGKEIIFTPFVNIKNAVREALINIKSGINLLLASMAGALILGSGRFIVDGKWGIEQFGKFSFAISLANFFLVFIGQISMILFPALCQTDRQSQKRYFITMKDILNICLPMVFLMYIPVKFLISLWLPQYTDSLRYLVLLLPLCTFDGKMNLLCNTYLKVLRKECILLYVNIASFFVSIGFSFVGAYVFDSIHAVVLFMVAAIAFRNIISELYLAKTFHISAAKSIISELILCILFILFTWFMNAGSAFLGFVIVYTGYLILNCRELRSVIAAVKNMLKK